MQPESGQARSSDEQGGDKCHRSRGQATSCTLTPMTTSDRTRDRAKRLTQRALRMIADEFRAARTRAGSQPAYGGRGRPDLEGGLRQGSSAPRQPACRYPWPFACRPCLGLICPSGCTQVRSPSGTPARPAASVDWWRVSACRCATGQTCRCRHRRSARRNSGPGISRSGATGAHDDRARDSDH